MYSVDIYSRVRRACLKDGMSAREGGALFQQGSQDDREDAEVMLCLPGIAGSEPSYIVQPLMLMLVSSMSYCAPDKALIKKQRHTVEAHF